MRSAHVPISDPRVQFVLQPRLVVVVVLVIVEVDVFVVVVVVCVVFVTEVPVSVVIEVTVAVSVVVVGQPRLSCWQHQAVHSGSHNFFQWPCS